jgi:hypothetical protein
MANKYIELVRRLDGISTEFSIYMGHNYSLDYVEEEDNVRYYLNTNVETYLKERGLDFLAKYFTVKFTKLWYNDEELSLKGYVFITFNKAYSAEFVIDVFDKIFTMLRDNLKEYINTGRISSQNTYDLQPLAWALKTYTKDFEMTNVLRAEFYNALQELYDTIITRDYVWYIT